MPTIDQFITFFYTQDLAKTAHFYETILQLPLERDQGDCRIYRLTDSAAIGFCQRDYTPTEQQPFIITLVTEDVDAWYNSLLAQNIQFQKAPALNPKYNIYHCFLRDPNGYLVEIQRFMD